MHTAMPRTWLLSGVPRSGTSLCCRLAGDLPDTVVLSEPIRRKAFGGMDTPQGACARIGDFAEQARAGILAERRASSVQVDGRLDDNRSASRHTDAGLRRLRSEWGEIAIGKPLSEHFTLLIKHNALFAALLPRLTESFSCLALVRNPLSVLASWQTVDLPVHRGRIPAGVADASAPITPPRVNTRRFTTVPATGAVIRVRASTLRAADVRSRRSVIRASTSRSSATTSLWPHHTKSGTLGSSRSLYDMRLRFVAPTTTKTSGVTTVRGSHSLRCTVHGAAME